MLGGIVLLMPATVGLRTSSQVALSDAQLRDQQAKIQDATTWQGLTTANVARVVASVISSDPAVEAAMKPEIEVTTARIGEIQKRIEAAAVDDEERNALAAIATARKAYIDARLEQLTGNVRQSADAAAQANPLAASTSAAPRAAGKATTAASRTTAAAPRAATNPTSTSAATATADSADWETI